MIRWTCDQCGKEIGNTTVRIDVGVTRPNGTSMTAQFDSMACLRAKMTDQMG